MNGEAAKSLAAFLLQVYEQEHQTTKKILACVPDSKHGWQPHDKAMSAGKLAAHIAGADIFFLEGIVAGEFPRGGDQPEVTQTTAQLVADYEKNFKASVAKVRALPAESLARTINFFGMFEAPAVTFLSLASNHTIHHRGQLSTYLRTLGEKVPSIYGPSADETFEMLQAKMQNAAAEKARTASGD